MFGRLFNTDDVDGYADWIVDEVKRTLPAGFDPTLRNVEQKVDMLDRKIALRSQEFVKSSKLNLFKKARLVSRIRDGMQEHGYPESFIKSFSMNILERVQTIKGKTKP